MKLGKRGCLKALLETRDLIEKDEIVYICSRIWLTDYCCWVQKCDDKVLFALASEINHLIKQLKDIDDVAGSVSLDFHPSSSDAAATIDDNTAHSTDLLSLEQTKITISSLSSWDLSALHTLSKSLQSDANDEIIDH